MRARLHRPLIRSAIALALATAMLAPGYGAATLAPATALETSTATRWYSHSIVRNGTTQRIAYCGNGPLVADANVRRVIVMVHGESRNACGAAGAALEAARLADRLHQTLVIAPHFITTEDPEAETSDRIYWSTGGWKEGANSRDVPHPRPWRMSSFAVVDDLVSTVQTLFPGLEATVIAGHSAGGQFANRYAAGTRVAGHARFVVANPSSYLYLDARRWSGKRFVVPSTKQIGACPGYDTYKYGMAGLNVYMGSVGADLLRSQYGSRRVTYLLGELDNDPSDPSLDTNCAAGWQGKHRLERGQRFVDSLGKVYGRTVYGQHVLTTVPEAGHGVRAMFTSPQGRASLFE
jgi:pimeloyl-ACP methyl ester carboxylesterase